MDIGLMVEGQNGLTWERWRHITALAERLGFPTLFRSDHYFLSPEQQHDSLEAYVSFVTAALETERIRFGPLVTPITFRQPVNVARMAAQIDQLSNGRFVMGLGAGWNEGEHRAYGLAFPPTRERFDRLDDAIELMRALWSPGRASHAGPYYQLQDVDCQPKPAPGRPPLLVGGVGEKRTLRTVARYADEWNCTPLPLDDYARKVRVLERHCAELGRDPATIRRSMMVFGVVGRTPEELEARARPVMGLFAPGRDLSFAEFRPQAEQRGLIIGTTDEVLETLAGFARLGLQEAQFQHFDFHSDAVPEYLAAELAPRAKSL